MSRATGRSPPLDAPLPPLARVARGADRLNAERRKMACAVLRKDALRGNRPAIIGGTPLNKNLSAGGGFQIDQTGQAVNLLAIVKHRLGDVNPQSWRNRIDTHRALVKLLRLKHLSRLKRNFAT